MRGEIRRIQRELGITTLYVTHDQEEALAVSDRVAVMEAGPGRAGWDARGRYTRSRGPAFVAQFVGLSNAAPGDHPRPVRAPGVASRPPAGASKARRTCPGLGCWRSSGQAVQLIAADAPAAGGTGEGAAGRRGIPRRRAPLRRIRTRAGALIVADIHKPTGRSDDVGGDSPCGSPFPAGDVRFFPADAPP